MIAAVRPAGSGATLGHLERIAHVGSWEVDLAANRLTYSDEALRIHGLQPGEFDGTLSAAIALAHPEDRLRVSAAINATLYEGKPFAIDYRIVRPDGTVRHVRAEDEVIRDAEGRPLRAFGITQDITARKEAEIALARSEERLRGIYEGLLFGVFTVDSTGAVESANPALARMLGYGSAAELLGRIADVAGEIYAEPGARRRFRQQLFAAGAVQGFETRWRRKDGSVFPVSLSARLAPDAAAGDYSYIGLAEDIGFRKRAEEALRESEERYRTLIAAMAEGIVMQDASGAIVACNESAERILGLTREQMLGRTSIDPRWQAIHEDGSPFPGEDHPAMLTLRTGAPQFDVTMGIRKPGGTLTWISINSRALVRAGEAAPHGVVTTFHDITERVRTERALREQEQRLALLADNVPAMIAYLDADRRLRYANLRYRMFYGGSAAPVEGRALAEVLTPEALRAALPGVERALAGEAVSVTGERRLHDGSLRHVTVSLVPHRDDATAAVLGMYILALDITAQHRAETALRESAAGLRQAQEMARLAHIVTGVDGVFEHWSEGLPALIGAKEVPPSTREWLALVHPEDRERFRSTAIEAARTHRGGAVDYRLRRGDGTLIHVRQIREPVGPPEAAGPSRWFNTIQDVSEQKQAEERIKRLNRVYAVLSGINGAIVRIRDRRELFAEACRIAVEGGGFRMAWVGVADRAAGLVRPVAWAGEGARGFLDAAPLAIMETGPGGQGLAGRAVRERKPMISSDVVSDPQRLMRAELAERGINSLAVMPLIVGDEAAGVLALYSSESLFFDEEEMRLLLELAGDISFALDHIEKEERVRYLAYYDSLTGLANRTLFLERASQHLARAAQAGSRLALLIINVDRFKTINDSLGRQAGDALLAEFARRLAAAAGDPALVARVGSDHFAVLLPEVKNEESLINRLERGDARVMAEPFAIAGTELRIATRSGVAVYPQDAADAESLFRNAEAALKRAKPGEKYLFYRQEMTERIAEKLTLENRLRAALQKSEFVLHYQPKLDLGTRRVIGAEALIRWASPEGLVAPGQFIPLLEETGLILPVGEWAMAEAVAQARRLAELGLPPVRIAVNVSALQLRQRDFVARVQAVLAGVSPAALDLEITESLLMDDVGANVEKLKAVGALGVNVAIDDFGTGYSSLSYLARLPVQSLKIDRSFVAAMAQNTDTLTLVSTIVSLARSLRLRVIAEGVENEAQEALLRAMRCDEAQGFLYARPLPAAQFEALLRKSRVP